MKKSLPKLTCTIAERPKKSGRVSAYEEVLNKIIALPKDKSLQIQPRLNRQENQALRVAARSREFAISIRNTPECSYVWIKGTAKPYPSQIWVKESA